MFFKDHRIERTKKGEIMDGFKPLIDYANHRRCDDDIKLADRLIFLSKYIGVITVCCYLWFVVLDLAFTAAGM